MKIAVPFSGVRLILLGKLVCIRKGTQMSIRPHRWKNMCISGKLVLDGKIAHIRKVGAWWKNCAYQESWCLVEKIVLIRKTLMYRHTWKSDLCKVTGNFRESEKQNVNKRKKTDVIHIKKLRKDCKIHLCTKLYTLSTYFSIFFRQQ